MTNNRPEGTVLQANFKTRQGTLLNVYASNAAELSQLLEELEATATQVAALEGVLGAVSAAAPVSAPPSQQPREEPYGVNRKVPSGTPIAKPSGGGAAPTCQQGCGPKVYREGTSKAGKPYKAWFCSNPDRNAQCKPEWV